MCSQSCRRAISDRVGTDAFVRPSRAKLGSCRQPQPWHTRKATARGNPIPKPIRSRFSGVPGVPARPLTILATSWWRGEMPVVPPTDLSKLLILNQIVDAGSREEKSEKKTCINSSVVVNYITRYLDRAFGNGVASEPCRLENFVAKETSAAAQKERRREKENTEYEITHRTFRCIRSNRRHRVRSRRPCRPVRRAKVLHNHEKPGGRVGRPRHRPGDAADVRRQTAAPLPARDITGKRPRARVPGSRNAVGR